MPVRGVNHLPHLATRLNKQWRNTLTSKWSFRACSEALYFLPAAVIDGDAGT